MDTSTRERLANAGAHTRAVAASPGIEPADRLLICVKIALPVAARAERMRQGLTQPQMAHRLDSS